MLRSASTNTRPIRSTGTVRPRRRPMGDAVLPAAQKTVRATIRSSPMHTACGSTDVTIVLDRTSTPSSRRSRSACAARSSANVGRMRGPPSSRMTRAVAVSMRRKSPRKLWRAIVGNIPANSTPVGPPPTITNVRYAARSASSVAFSASSNAVRKRRRISIASSTFFSPGASASHSGCPKYEWRAPAAMIR